MLRRDRKYFLQILVQEDLLTVKDAAENLNFGDGHLSISYFTCRTAIILVHLESGDIYNLLGEDSKRSFSLLTMKGKKAVRAWPAKLQDRSMHGMLLHEISVNVRR